MNKKLRSVKKPKIFLVFSGVIITAFVAVIDYITGYELGFSLFYLAPVFMLSFMVGRNAGILVGILAAISWTTCNRLAGRPYTHIFFFYWNVMGRATLYIIFACLISSLKEAFEREKKFARRDFIRDIANAKAFYERLELEKQRMLRYKRPLTLAYLDCDRFKEINDRFGHNAGDKALCLIANSIKDNIRAIDMVARIGGDEFVILFPDTGYTQVEPALLRVQKKILENMQKENWLTSVSMGVVTFMSLPESIDEMVKKADNLMYAAKKEGKNIIKRDICKEKK